MNENNKTNFIITEDDFYLDKSNDELSQLQQDFLSNKYKTLYGWGFKERPKNEHASALFLYEISEQFIKSLTNLPELEIAREESRVVITDEIWKRVETKIPYILGSEFITQEWVNQIFIKLNEVFSDEIIHYKDRVSLYLAMKNQNLKTPERVFFHLVENKDVKFPFAFMATYATKVKDGKIRHMPLTYALEEFKQDRDKLLSLLSCLNKVAEQCPWVESFMQSGELFHPLKLTMQEAYELLKYIEIIEKCGVLCRIPNWWRKKYTSVSLSLKLGEKKPSLVGWKALIEMVPVLVVDGVELSKQDIKNLLGQSEGLAFLKGKWIEVNHDKLRKLLQDLDCNKKEITLFDALRMNKENIDRDADNGIVISNGQWLSSFLSDLKNPKDLKNEKLPRGLKAILRPYQNVGYAWLHQMDFIGFGACLADDMGLGKTVQVLTFLQKKYEKNSKARVLLVVPASLLENWKKEANKFVPKLTLHLLHGLGSKAHKQELANLPFLTITTYGMVSKLTELADISWDCIILDEAQAIKNPLALQTKVIKKLKGSMRIAMTGTPIENELGNLWSLFDFLNKGLLGSSTEFKQFCKSLQEHPEGYEKLKSIVSPFILRRLKTDKTIISDLPDKVETIDYVSLSKQQIVLYRKLVNDMEEKLLHTEGIEHKGLVLATITKLKQICNHPDQFLGIDSYNSKDSGKFELLKELCETIYEKRERVLVFTQYTEIIPYLSQLLTTVFMQKGFEIHGKTPIKQRSKIVEQFNQESYVPFIVCSLKAAGTGLNLTAASHVVHFDRWWNPAVENQATDRAFRIGQKKNVLVHKFVSKGTIEEKIDDMINSKKALAEAVISSENKNWITDLTGDDLMSLLRLDV